MVAYTLLSLSIISSNLFGVCVSNFRFFPPNIHVITLCAGHCIRFASHIEIFNYKSLKIELKTHPSNVHRNQG